MVIVSPASRIKRSKSFARIYGGPLIACIDMGTNSFHMIVCQAIEDRDHFEVIMREKEAVPFFRRALTAHTIDEAGISAAIRILKDMKTKAAQCGAKTILAVATSAVREANNGEEVLDRIRRELDIDARMISGHEEARLIYLGVIWSMPALDGPFAIVDIGGGSTEIILGDRSATRFSESYKLGAARLTQRFFKKERPSPQEIRELHDEVRGVLRPAAARIDESGGFKRLIGTSGTIQALAKLDRIRSQRKNNELHGYELFLNDLEQLVDWLETTFLSAQRIKELSVDRNRTILAGAIVLLETLRSFEADSVIICTAALREGVIVDRFLQTGWLKGSIEHHKDPRSGSVHELLDKYHASVEHAEQVARLAGEIYIKTIGTLHTYPEEVAHLLWSAAMLHDVGMFIGRNGHHKHSYYLIKNGGLLGHSEEEVSLIASIARYHRGSEPKDSHEAFQSIPESQRRMVTEMAAILRLAEALDRSHRQSVQRLELDFESEGKNKDGRRCVSLIIYVRTGENWEPETWALKEKKALFEKCFNARLTFEVRVDNKANGK
ncbi:MAG TPA: Ppx/GppA phosphatase family protein [Candidatus Obscuribacterales bacterium]